ncbi:hypothetical protein ABW21_db0207312 [Orbilia brochopaga]|nr:hypothetical protein ABW21_db0207312 [Drechslerella brochopaga]
MASTTEIDSYLEEVNKSHFRHYAAAKGVRTRLQLQTTAANRMHDNDILWKDIKRSINLILHRYNLKGRMPNIEVQMRIATEVSESEPLKSQCDSIGQNPSWFTSWFVYDFVRRQSLSEKRRAKKRSGVARQSASQTGSNE